VAAEAETEGMDLPDLLLTPARPPLARPPEDAR
jgi:hypothetical protein